MGEVCAEQRERLGTEGRVESYYNNLSEGRKELDQDKGVQPAKTSDLGDSCRAGEAGFSGFSVLG